MFKSIIKRIFGDNGVESYEDAGREPILGHFLGIENADLDVDEFGPAKELDEIVQGKGLDLREVIKLINTEVSISEVMKTRPEMEFGGGEYAMNTIGFMDALISEDIEELESNARRLIENSALENFVLSAVSADGQLHGLKVLINIGASIDSVSEMGMTPLHWAAANSQTKAAKLLKEAGADCGKLSDLNINPAEVAFLNGYLELAEYLLPESYEETKRYSEAFVFERLGVEL